MARRSLLRILWAEPYTEKEKESQGGEGFAVCAKWVSMRGERRRGQPLHRPRKVGRQGLGKVWCVEGIPGWQAAGNLGLPGPRQEGASLPLVGVSLVGRG